MGGGGGGGGGGGEGRWRVAAGGRRRRVAPRGSPRPRARDGAAAEASRRTPRILLSTSEESASPVTSSAMMSSGSFFETRPSSKGTSSCMLEILRSVTRTSGFSSSATCDSWFLTKYGEMKPRSISIPSVNSTSSVSVCPSSTIVAPLAPTRLKQFEIVLPIVWRPSRSPRCSAGRRRCDRLRHRFDLGDEGFDAFWSPAAARSGCSRRDDLRPRCERLRQHGRRRRRRPFPSVFGATATTNWRRQFAGIGDLDVVIGRQSLRHASSTPPSCARSDVHAFGPSVCLHHVRHRVGPHEQRAALVASVTSVAIRTAARLGSVFCDIHWRGREGCATRRRQKSPRSSRSGLASGSSSTSRKSHGLCSSGRLELRAVLPSPPQAPSASDRLQRQPRGACPCSMAREGFGPLERVQRPRAFQKTNWASRKWI